MEDKIVIKGARVHNLKNIDVTIPRNKLVVFTGVSGSGKSSLAFDTLFAEGQRRYVESLSSYARQFLGQMDKPDVDSIDGLSPAISIDQKTTSKNPRSTVGTVTEIYDYLRLLYARIGIPHCPKCGKEIVSQTIDAICDKIISKGDGAKVIILAPVVRGRKGEYVKLLDSFKRSGYARVKIDGITYTLDEEIKLDKNLKHDISVVVDRLVIKNGIETRLTDSLETALKMGDGLVVADTDGREETFSTKFACTDCGISIEEVTPRLFSFNSPYGACPECNGLGFKNVIDVNRVVDWDKSLAGGALNLNGWNFDTAKHANSIYAALAKRHNFSMHTPLKDLPKETVDLILYGNNEVYELEYKSANMHTFYNTRFEGVIPNLYRRYKETTSDYVKADIERYMIEEECEVCKGRRLKTEALAFTIGGKNIMEFCNMPIDKALEFIDGLKFTDKERTIAHQILIEIRARLNFLANVGLKYLTLSRASATLSGGESQRIRLATQIGSGLVGVLYILDEPSIGLHQRDNGKLLSALKRLRDLGNTLVVVEHDEETMMSADCIIDIGVGAGENGGKLVASGTPQEIMNCKESVTGQYLSGRKRIEVPRTRRVPSKNYLEVSGAAQNNLKNIDVKIPIGLITAVTGVSGSGKSSLVNGILYPALASELNNAEKLRQGKYDKINGMEFFDKVINIDQSPIGRTPRSNPATYTGVFTAIRDLFAMTPDAKARGYNSGRFSFNVKGGRCENCSGDGILKIEMHFLPDVFVPCDVCHGKRYNRDTLEVKYKGKSIYDVLEMTISEACEFFENIPSIYGKIKTLDQVGLGYMKLGQPATTLSGGEAQRVKLATELSKRSTGKTCYILDEPTTGLHTADVDKLIYILQSLAESGNTVIVIEHNLDVIKTADYVIDLGPEGGDEGGTVVATGTPEEIAEVKESATGQYLKKVLNK